MPYTAPCRAIAYAAPSITPLVNGPFPSALLHDHPVPADTYRRIFDTSHLGIVILSANLRVIEVNRAFSVITGYSEADMRRRTLADIVHPSHAAAERKFMRDVRAFGEDDDQYLETRYIGSLGNVIWVNTHVVAEFDKRGKLAYFHAIIDDVTARKRLEAELAEQHVRTLEKEKEIQRLKDEFIFIAAHELRSPVTAIGWSLDLLDEALGKGTATTDVTEAMRTLRASSKGLGKLVSDLLEVSRLEYGTFKVIGEKFEMAKVIDEAVAEAEPTACARSIGLKVLRPKVALPAVFGDKSRVREVLMNLLSNAIKYNRVGGSVTVYAEAVGKDVHVSVEDTGFGLEADAIPKLFHRFSRIDTKETHDVEGTGLGLFIVKQAIERMNGRVWAESDGPGKGSTFSLSIPKAK